MIKRRVLALALALSSVFAASSAFAGSTTGSLAASATLTGTCTVAVTNAAFGSLSSLSIVSAPLTVTTPLTITCTKSTPYTVTADNGVFVASSSTGRMMMNYAYTSQSGPMVSWILYQDSGFTTVMGRNADGFTGTGTGVAQVKNLYAQIQAGQTLPAGNYYDSVTFTVAY